MFGHFALVAGVSYIYLGCHSLMAPATVTERRRDRIARWLRGIALLALGACYLSSFSSH